MVGVDSLFAKVHSFLSLGSNDDTHGRITLLRHIQWRKWAEFGPLPCAQSVPLCTLLHLNQVAWNLPFSPTFQCITRPLRLFRLQQLFRFFSIEFTRPLRRLIPESVSH